jgi:hypothetical protein
MKYPVTVREPAAADAYLSDAELAELVRWIDGLDRL